MLKTLDMQQFDSVYRLMQASFPADEFRTYDAQKALLTLPRYAVYIKETKGQIEAFLAVWEFEEFLFLEHFAVSPEMRNRGIGGEVLKAFIARHKKPICLEVELPETEIAARRIGFYERNGFSYLDFPYFQPPLSEGKQAVPLRLMTTGGGLDEEAFHKIKNTLYKEVYQYEEWVVL